MLTEDYEPDDIPIEVTDDVLAKLKYLPAAPVYDNGMLVEDREILYLRIFAHNPDPPVFIEKIHRYLLYSKNSRARRLWRKYRAPFIYSILLAMAAAFAIGIVFISDHCEKVTGIRIGNNILTDNDSLTNYMDCNDKHSTIIRNCGIGAVCFSLVCSVIGQVYYSYDDKKFELIRNHVQDAINSLLLLYTNVAKALLAEYISRLEEIRYEGYENLDIETATPKILDKMCKKIEGPPRISFREMHAALDCYGVIEEKMTKVLEHHRAHEVLRPFRELKHLLREDGGRRDLLLLILRPDLTSNPAKSRNQLIRKIATEDLKTIMRTIEIFH